MASEFYLLKDFSNYFILNDNISSYLAFFFLLLDLIFFQKSIIKLEEGIYDRSQLLFNNYFIFILSYGFFSNIYNKNSRKGGENLLI